ncbi:MAG: SPASM domain-containing protein [Erysipelotrichales bacterium]|nr:SPASM domain-containing protein [Erysipelotrichales bacterium]
MRYRRVYLEITPRCNLSCSFCVQKRIKREDLSYADFCAAVKQIAGVTDTLYYHVMGEPLLHEDLDAMMDEAWRRGLRSAITTNGLLLGKKIGKWKDKKISRINVSLHAYIDKDNSLSQERALRTVEEAEIIQKETGSMVFLRLWDSDNTEQKELEKRILDRYGVLMDESVFQPNGIALSKGIRLQKDRKFVWPMDAEHGKEHGFCLGLRTHFAVLSDLTVVPCCLDAKGDLALGNLREKPLEEILNSARAKEIYEGFSRRKTVEEICRHCEYKERFGG